MKILIVDDQPVNRDLLATLLDSDDYHLVFADNGLRACELCQSDESIDLVLMDVVMPVMDGLLATKTIKQHNPDRYLPVLFVTALDDEDNLGACLNCGGDDFIPKPVSETVLVAKLKAHERAKQHYVRLQQANTELLHHRRTVERELAVVEHIFNNASNRNETYSDNLNFYTSAMSLFNGDMVLVAPSPTGGLYFLVGDFTGHGLAAAIGSLPTTEIFYQCVQRGASISQIVRELNERLHRILPCNMFFCAAIAEIAPQGTDMTLWLGGMNDVLLFHADTVRTIESDHMPMGILPNEEFDDSPRLITLSPGERVYAYTDGVIEATNVANEEFGHQRLLALLANNEGDQIQNVIRSVDAFCERVGQTDDISLLEFRAGKIIHRNKSTHEQVDVVADSYRGKSIPWNLRLELRDSDLCSTSVVDQIMSFIASIEGIELHQDKIFTIVSELYNNSLEHGVLRLDSSIKSNADGFERYYQLRTQRMAALRDQYILVEFDHLRTAQDAANQVRIVLEDSGDGFDVNALAPNNHAEESHGRGIDLLRELCSSIEYSKQGRRVTACYDLSQH